MVHVCTCICNTATVAFPAPLQGMWSVWALVMGQLYSDWAWQVLYMYVVSEEGQCCIKDGRKTSKQTAKKKSEPSCGLNPGPSDYSSDALTN